MTPKRIIENLKKYIDGEINTWKRRGNIYGKQPMIDRCYGAMMYSSYLLSSEDFEIVGKWWDDKMLPRLREMELGD